MLYLLKWKSTFSPISNALCDFEEKIKPWSILTLNVTDLWIDNMIQNFWIPFSSKVYFNGTVSHHEDSQQYAENVNVFWMLPPYVTYSDANYDPGINYIETQQGPKFSVSSKIDKIIEQNRMPQKCEKKIEIMEGKADEQTDRLTQTGRQTDRQTNWYTDWWPDGQTDTRADRRIHG